MPNYLKQEVTMPLGRVLMGLLIAAGVGVTGNRVLEFNSAGKLDPNTDNATVLEERFNAFVTQTGSLTADYAATCVPNPGKALGLSGTTLRELQLQVKNNPASIEADIVFTPDCASTVESGTLLVNLDNVASQSGVTVKFGSGSGVKWFKDDFIKVILKGVPTAGYSARLRGWYEDNFAY